MVLSKIGETLQINKKVFIVGNMVKANGRSHYEGLTGELLLITTEDDKETDNYGPDIYVDFGEGEVIMADYMLEVLD